MYGYNVFAILVAAASAFMLGGLWYSKALFGQLWNSESGMDKKAGGHPARVFGVSFVFAVIAAIGFAYLIGPAPELRYALKQGAIVGLCFVTTSFGINYQFANRSNLMWAIDSGYHALQFILYGLVLGIWH